MKQKQIFYRYNNDLNALKHEVVDLVSKCYLMLGQKPETAQIVIMSKLMLEDIVNTCGSMEMEEVVFAIEEGLKGGDNESAFLNARAWNVWLKKHKEQGRLSRQKNTLDDYTRLKDSRKQIAQTINKAKRLG